MNLIPFAIALPVGLIEVDGGLRALVVQKHGFFEHNDFIQLLSGKGQNAM